MLRLLSLGNCCEHQADGHNIVERWKTGDCPRPLGEEIELSLWTAISQYQMVTQKILTATVRRRDGGASKGGSPFDVIEFQLSSSSYRRSTHFYETLNAVETLDGVVIEEVEGAEDVAAKLASLRVAEDSIEGAPAEKVPIKSIDASQPSETAQKHKRTPRRFNRLAARGGPAFKGSRRAVLRLEQSLWRWISLSLAEIDILSAESLDIGLKSLPDTTTQAAWGAVQTHGKQRERLTFTAMISYIHGEAREHALKLKGTLEDMGVSCYLDRHEILLGSDWVDSLNEAITGCEALVALVTPSYGSTLWTARELKLADLLGKHIIPVNFDQHWPPAPLAIQCATMQYIRWSSSPASDDHHDAGGAMESFMSGSWEAGCWPQECVLEVAKQIKLSIERVRARRHEMLARQLMECNGLGRKRPRMPQRRLQNNDCSHHHYLIMEQEALMEDSKMNYGPTTTTTTTNIISENECLITSGGGWPLAHEEENSNRTNYETSDYLESEYYRNNKLNDSSSWHRRKGCQVSATGNHWLQLKLPPTHAGSPDSSFSAVSINCGSSGADSAFFASSNGSSSSSGGCQCDYDINDEDQEEPDEEELEDCVVVGRTIGSSEEQPAKKSCSCKLRLNLTSHQKRCATKWRSTRNAFNKLKKNLTWFRASTAANTTSLVLGREAKRY